MTQPTDPMASAYAAYEQLESRLSTAMDQLVATNGFAELFTTSATTMMALSRMVNGAIDRAARSTRLAARQDVTSLARQLARTEDKLERLLQAVEGIQDQLDLQEQASGGPAVAAEPGAPVPAAGSSNGTTRRAPAKRAAAKKAAAGRAAVNRTAGDQS
ncbi:MAG: hypothetical protein WAL50_12605 [Kineosporiaceae bacterium]